MQNRERFHALMRLQPVDRLPVIEWAGWWDKTVERWRDEGLPGDLKTAPEIREHFGLDRYLQIGLPLRMDSFPPAPGHGKGVVASMDDYLAVKEHLYPDPEEALDKDLIARLAEEQARGDSVIWITIEGFFWFPRTLFGIQPHMYAFYEHPELMHTMNQDLADHSRRVFEAFCAICVPDFMTFAEDMSYNNGPMISRDLFDEFMTPYYNQVCPVVRDHGTIPFVDSDGDVAQLLPWFLDVGVVGFLPLERQAGCDLVAMRTAQPDARFIGGYDKMVMHLGEDALRAEFERLLPIMRQGGYIPSCDHQTPPAVSLEDYKLYVRLQKEYAALAAQ